MINIILTSRSNIQDFWSSPTPCTSHSHYTVYNNYKTTYNFVSMASFCMISMMVLQALVHPSGVEWMVMGFSAAPAFSFLCMSILQTRKKKTWLKVNASLQLKNLDPPFCRAMTTYFECVCLVMLRMVAPSLPMIAPTNCVGTRMRRGTSDCTLGRAPRHGELERGGPRALKPLLPTPGGPSGPAFSSGI